MFLQQALGECVTDGKRGNGQKVDDAAQRRLNPFYFTALKQAVT